MVCNNNISGRYTETHFFKERKKSAFAEKSSIAKYIFSLQSCIAMQWNLK